MSTRPWMPLYVGDYRADTTHLNAAQHGAYLLLIMHYWQQGCLPDDDAQLARIACMSPAEWRRHRPVIRAFFGEGWRHDRCDEEIERTAASYNRRAEAGRRGGKAKAKRAPQNSSNATAMLKQGAKQCSSKSQPQSHPLRGSPSQGEGSSKVEGRVLGEGDARPWPGLAVVNGGVGSEGSR